VWRNFGGNPAEVPGIMTGPMDAEGWFAVWMGQFGLIGVNSKVQSTGQAANTIYHEAMHARLRVMFPWLAENSATYDPAKAVLFRHFDEILGYGYGGYGQFVHGSTMIDRLEGLATVAFSPWLAYASAHNGWEALPGLVRDAMLLTVLAIAMIRIAMVAGAAALLACFGYSELTSGSPEPVVLPPIELTTPGP
jgi:hypothetical protein